MIEAFSRKELEAVDRLLRDPDFTLIVEHIKRNCTGLALSACQVAGLESEKIKGGSLVLQEVRDQILFARNALKRFEENDELPTGRDPISP